MILGRTLSWNNGGMTMSQMSFKDTDYLNWGCLHYIDIAGVREFELGKSGSGCSIKQGHQSRQSSRQSVSMLTQLPTIPNDSIGRETVIAAHEFPRD
jgi:hypothetical protein